MKITLEFHSDGSTGLKLAAETDGEKAILAFLTENGRVWAAQPTYDYRPSAVSNAYLFQTTLEALVAEASR